MGLPRGSHVRGRGGVISRRVVVCSPYGGANRPLVLSAAAIVAAALIAGCGGGGSDSTGTATTHVAAVAPADLHGCGRHILRDFRCGSVQVPWERADPSLGKTSIGFAVRPADDRAAGRRSTPIVAVEGGPGYASTRSAPGTCGSSVAC